MQLYIAFLLSATLHACGDFKIHKTWQEGRSFPFFLSQALVIHLEDGILWIGRYFGARKNWYWKAVGHVWVVVWFIYCCPGWLGAAIEGTGGKKSMVVTQSLIMNVISRVFVSKETV
jgi:hypothetical protein